MLSWTEFELLLALDDLPIVQVAIVVPQYSGRRFQIPLNHDSTGYVPICTSNGC